MEIIDTMIRRRINIMCLQETQWVGEQSREIEHSGYKLWYTEKDKNRNGIGIIIDKSLENEVVEVKRMVDRILLQWNNFNQIDFNLT